MHPPIAVFLVSILMSEDKVAFLQVAKRKSVARNIKKRRKARKLTQVQLQKLAGVSQATISKIENGNAFVNIKTLIKLADALETTFEQLGKD